MGHSSRSSSSRHAQMTSAGVSYPLCSSEAIIHIPQRQSLDSPLPGSAVGPPAHLHTETSQQPYGFQTGYKGAFCLLFEGRGRRRSCTGRPLQSAELPGWK